MKFVQYDYSVTILLCTQLPSYARIGHLDVTYGAPCEIILHKILDISVTYHFDTTNRITKNCGTLNISIVSCTIFSLTRSTVSVFICQINDAEFCHVRWLSKLSVAEINSLLSTASGFHSHRCITIGKIMKRKTSNATIDGYTLHMTYKYNITQKPTPFIPSKWLAWLFLKHIRIYRLVCTRKLLNIHFLSFTRTHGVVIIFSQCTKLDFFHDHTKFNWQFIWPIFADMGRKLI